MLACARIGAIHSVVFGGFASVSLASRIDDARPTVVVSADAGSRAGKVVAYKPLLDEAIRAGGAQAGDACCWSIAAWRRCRAWPGATSTTRRCASGTSSTVVPCTWVDATHPSYTLYTSGTTGKPKGVQRDTGGYAVALAASMKHIFRGQRRRDLLLHQRHRLGRRPQLHRLRPADRRHGDHPVRRPAGPARRRHLVEPGREVQGHRDVQRADRGAGAEEARPSAPEARTTCRRCARCSWPASRSTSRPRAGSPRAWASRSSTTTGRPRPAGRS